MRKIDFNASGLKTLVADKLLNSEYVTEMRLSLPKGAVVDPHVAPHYHVMQVLSGAIEFTMDGALTTMKSFEMVEIQPNALHGITALQNSILRVSVFKRGEKEDKTTPEKTADKENGGGGEDDHRFEPSVNYAPFFAYGDDSNLKY